MKRGRKGNIAPNAPHHPFQQKNMKYSPKKNEALITQNGKMFDKAIEVGCFLNNYRFISRQELNFLNTTFYECPTPRALCNVFKKKEEC
jgi:hypothetical protein